MTPRTVLAATSGNVLEWYDFTAYSFLAPILGQVFFPSEDHFASLLAAFAVLAVGYLARPFGSVIFGHVGDRIGRKPALMISVVLMGSGSLLIAVLPTHAQIGVTAAILLVAIRVVQGMSVAGEYTPSGVMLVEQSEPRSRGFTGGWIAFAMMLGCVAGSGVPALLGTFLTDDQIHAWGWRIPFFVGSAAALYSAILRTNLTESSLVAADPDPMASPIFAAVKNHWRLMLQMVVLLIPTAVIYFIVFVYAGLAAFVAFRPTTIDSLRRHWNNPLRLASLLSHASAGHPAGVSGATRVFDLQCYRMGTFHHRAGGDGTPTFALQHGCHGIQPVYGTFRRDDADRRHLSRQPNRRRFHAGLLCDRRNARVPGRDTQNTGPGRQGSEHRSRLISLRTWRLALSLKRTA